MAINTGEYIKTFHDKAAAQGAKVISSDFALQIKGFEDMWLLSKQCPWPILSSQGEIEVPAPNGSATWQAQQAKFNQQGQVTFEETVAGSVDAMLLALLRNGGIFDATIYEGTPTNYLRAKPIYKAFLQLDNPDRDWENRAQILLFSGTMFFHYYGELLSGNSSAYQS